ncbi:peptide ABC transporter substrate-binding protein [Gordonia sp. DT30]|uniref:peptide ABC transporter substrate-binding protein n=1 Tax=unclassified Gordonia (in: high G+C Gram-positive bacteria) TaxID=2657482 RepID=UPI003CE738E4
MKLRKIWVAMGAAVVAAGVLSACGSSSDDSNGYIRVYGGEPETGLITTTTNENIGGRVVDSLFTGLYAYDAQGNPRPAMVDKLETTDNKNYTITIKKGWKFDDGTEVKAHNFVDAWNFGAYTPNAQKQQSFFEPIQGYDEVASEHPTVKTMSGLKVVDDYTFTVALKDPNIDFKLGLGFTPFKPLPDVAFKDINAFGQKPIGNGPYKFVDWQHNQKIDVEAKSDYPGPDKAKNKGITFVAYQDPGAAYSDLQSGNLDALEVIPTSALRTYKKDLGESQVVNKPVAANLTITIPENLPHFSGQEGRLRRQAISMAINRPQIAQNIFSGTRTPSTDFTSASLPGHDAHIPGSDVLTYNAAKAKDLWAQANAIAPWSGSFVIASNYDGGHKDWIDAASNDIKNTLGIDAHGESVPTFKQLRSEVNARTIRTAFRTGWQGDYPSILEFLYPLYVTGAGSNDGDYSNPQFDAAIHSALTQPTDDAAYKAANGSQQILLQDLPAIPLFDYVSTLGLAQGVKGTVTWNNLPDYPNLTKS